MDGKISVRLEELPEVVAEFFMEAERARKNEPQIVFGLP
jgi:hypothetical protein